ncbi:MULTISPECIES: hypothetical protein [Subtercola]|uniref:Uncharacterized protein n=1 Tax=Subtercola vilae TaxID=2056433 RepID=A0A4T2BSR8_9MICO|nr:MULTISPECIES: hypothetical protein [Subtercola]MEA9986472.1 hypothetical protein [Subtercola sp. RTI3]TIH33481.1 hypothetical protein D4765_14905 [Subtercola vilae]
MTDTAVPAAPSPEPLTRYQRWRHRFVTPQAIYGTLLVSAIIGNASEKATDREVLITTVGTMLVFWIAHVFADGIAHYGRRGVDGLPVSASLKHGVDDSAGLIYAAVVPCLFLLLGAVHIFDDSVAYDISLLLPIGLLGLLGWFAIGDRGGTWPVRLLGGIVTGLLGVLVIILKIVFH